MDEHECRGVDARGLCVFLPVAALLALVGLKVGKKHHEGCAKDGCARCAGYARHHAEHGHGEGHDHAGAHGEHGAHHEHAGGFEFRDFGNGHGPGPMRRRMDPLRILDKRYAAGEVDEDDYLRRRQVLKDNS